MRSRPGPKLISCKDNRRRYNPLAATRQQTLGVLRIETLRG